MTASAAASSPDVQDFDSASAPAGDSNRFGELAKHNLELRLFPVFDLRKRLASTLFCVPVRGETGNALKLGHWLVDNLPESDVAAVDLELLKTAIVYAKRFEGSGITAGIGTSVSFATLINARYRKDYIATLSGVSLSPLNPLVIQIENVPQGTPAPRIADAVNQLTQSIKHVLITVSAAGDFMSNLGALGAIGVGINLTGTENDATVARLARSLMALCRWQNALGYMNMLRTKESVDAAAAAGVRLGTGPALSLTMFTHDGDMPKFPIAARQI